jgi:hypothetical protein
MTGYLIMNWFKKQQNYGEYTDLRMTILMLLIYSRISDRKVDVIVARWEVGQRNYWIA